MIKIFVLILLIWPLCGILGEIIYPIDIEEILDNMDEYKDGADNEEEFERVKNEIEFDRQLFSPKVIHFVARIAFLPTIMLHGPFHLINCIYDRFKGGRK